MKFTAVTGSSSGSGPPPRLAELISASVRKSRRKFIGFIIGVFLLLEGFVLATGYETSRRRLSDWIILNQPQIEQAIFLQNALSLHGLLEQFRSSGGDLIERSVGIFSTDGKLLHGDLPGELGEEPRGNTQGYRFEPVPPRIHYSSELRFGGNPVGWIVIHGSLQLWKPFLHTLAAILICALILELFQGLLHALARTTEENAVKPLVQLREAMEKFGREQKLAPLDAGTSGLTLEVREVFTGYNAMIATIEDYSRKEGSAAAALALSELAAQVAHDIRSPLATLRLVMQDLSGFPETQRQISRQALERISDILHQLLLAYQQNDTTAAGSVVRPEHLCSALDEIIAEKRIQLRSRLGLRLELKITAECYGLFAEVDPVSFKRVISNLLDNSAEAISADRGDVRVSLSEMTNAQLEIVIEDTGKGIDPAILGRVGEKGVSFGKTAGSGLGIHHAKAAIQGWRGEIFFESPVSEGRGTRVRIRFPRSDRPEWFGAEIEIPAGARVAIVDDDESIHRLWDQRLAGKNLKLQHFTSTQAFGDAQADIYLMDYDLGDSEGSHVTGLDLIERRKIGLKSFLVTSHFDNAEIRRRAVEAGAQIIPKSLAAWVPIRD
jgi:signal transduction histidine kinase